MRAGFPSVIVASIPGRLRLRDGRLRDGPRCRALEGRLNAVAGVVTVGVSPATGSVLVHYDPAACPWESFERLAVEAFEAVCPGGETMPAATPLRSGPYRWQRERRWNRAAKWGMLASFPVSLALAAAGSKKLHAASGGVFSALLLVHLYVHRRHLIK